MMGKHSQRGFITVDFLFAFVLIMAFSTLLFALTMTLTVAEVTQYITFAAARNYVASHNNAITQNDRAKLKYQELMANPVFASFYKNNWFLVDKEPSIGDMTELQFPAYKQPTEESPNLFWGVGTFFTAKILDFKVPFYGSTTEEGKGDGAGFKTFIASYLGRDPTAAECYNFNVDRWKAIRTLTVVGASPYSTNTDENKYFIVTDNGC